MKEVKETTKKCVLIGCENKAVSICNNCRIPACNVHAKRFGRVYLCINCFNFTKKLRARI